jgi:hypothetical protein
MLICVLLGGGAGAFLSYRGLSKLVQARSVNPMAKFQKENAEFRLQMREAQREVEEYKSRIDELDKELIAAKRVERPAPAGRRAAAPTATTKPSTPKRPATARSLPATRAPASPTASRSSTGSSGRSTASRVQT